MALENIEQCPLCNQSAFATHLLCEDYLSSHEQFSIKRCVTCSFLITSPRPDPLSLPSYYESDRYVSHTGKSNGPFSFLYRLARKFTLRWKVGLIRKFKENPSILDYGCGTGELLHSCRQQGWKIAGLEPSTHAREKATLLTGTNIAGDIDQFKGEQFDVITLWHVLEHIMDLRAKLATFKTLLKKDGILIIAVPNCQSYDALTYQQHWAAYDVPRHLWHFTKGTMKATLNTQGFALKKILPMKLDAYYVSLLSEKYKHPGRIAPRIFLNGLATAFRSNQKARPGVNHSSLIYIAGKS